MPAGIYAIDHIPTRTRYVGATHDLDGRQKAHTGNLRKRVHTCARLQAMYDTHGEDSLTWTVLEFAPELSGVHLAQWLKDAEIRWGESSGEWNIIVRTNGYGGSAKIGKRFVVSTEIPTSLRDDADKRAKQEGRSRSEILHRAIRFYLDHAPVVRADEIPAPAPSKPRKEGNR